jgi:hypothetical protein
VPEIIDPVFAKTSQNARFLLSENERFGLVFVKTGSINSGTGVHLPARLKAIDRRAREESMSKKSTPHEGRLGIKNLKSKGYENCSRA